MHTKKTFSQKISSKGFTLLEMLTVLAIFGIVSAVVLFNHGKFTSETILTNMAYEVALSIREAQIYGVSVRANDSASFENPYGIFIPSPASSNIRTYALFTDTDGNSRYGGGDCGGEPECVTDYTFQRDIFISETRVKFGSGSCSGLIDQSLHITFNRPNPEPILRIGEGSNNSGIGFAQAEITIETRDRAKRFVVISNNGQIAVQNTSICE